MTVPTWKRKDQKRTYKDVAIDIFDKTLCLVSSTRKIPKSGTIKIALKIEDKAIELVEHALEANNNFPSTAKAWETRREHLKAAESCCDMLTLWFNWVLQNKREWPIKPDDLEELQRLVDEERKLVKSAFKNTRIADSSKRSIQEMIEANERERLRLEEALRAEAAARMNDDV